MPTERFYRLKKQKKDRIVEASLKEFGLHDFEHINIQNIIKDAAISRGSFYQYFADLDDLFGYLVDLIVQEKQSYLAKHAVLHGDAPFFDRIGELYRLGYQFALDNPLIHEAGKHMVKPVSTTHNHMVKTRQDALYDYYQTEIQKDIDRGIIRDDIDMDILIHIIQSFLDELTQSHFIEQRLTQTEVNQRFERFITLLKKGIL